MTNRKAFKYRGTKCLNCDTDLDKSEKYCHHCGQLNSTKKLTLRDFIDEFFANFYAYDSRLKNTLTTLFTKPGIAAKEFVEGKRHKHANPFRLFLSASIFLFLLIKVSEEKSKITEDFKFIKAELIDSNSKSSGNLNISNSGLKLNKGNILKNKYKFYHKDSIYYEKDIKNVADNITAYNIRFFSIRNFNNQNPDIDINSTLVILGYKNNTFTRFLYKKIISLKSNDIGREIQDFFMTNLPFLIFLAVPFIAIMFWLLYYNQIFNYTDHLVFTYSFYSFVLICLIIGTLIDFINTTLANYIVSFCFIIIFPFYLYKSLRNFYQNKRWKTIFKFILLNILFIPISVITLIFLFFISLILY